MTQMAIGFLVTHLQRMEINNILKSKIHIQVKLIGLQQVDIGLFQKIQLIIISKVGSFALKIHIKKMKGDLSIKDIKID